MINRRILLAAGAVAACAPRAPAELTLAEVIARHTEARGGAAALDAVRNTLNIAEVVEPTFTVLGRYIASADGFMRIDVFHQGARAISEGVDSAGEWFWPGDAPAPLPASDVAVASGALRHGIEFNVFGLHALPARGHTLALEGRELIADINYYKIKLTLADGFETWRYINPDTWMTDRSRDLRALHPDVDPTPIVIETEYTDFRPVAGVLSSYHWVQRTVASNETLQTGTIQRLEYNAPPEALNFPRTASVIPI